MNRLMLLLNDNWIILVLKTKPSNTNSISYYYFYSTNVPNRMVARCETVANDSAGKSFIYTIDMT